MDRSPYTRRKSVQQLRQGAGESPFDRALGPGHLIALGVGAIIGAGIFVIYFGGSTLVDPVGPTPAI